MKIKNPNHPFIEFSKGIGRRSQRGINTAFISAKRWIDNKCPWYYINQDLAGIILLLDSTIIFRIHEIFPYLSKFKMPALRLRES